MSASSRNRYALVTGAGRRIGRAIAMELASAGWGVAVHYFNSSGAAEEVVRDIVDHGGQACAVAADLSDEAQASTLIEKANSQLGPLSCLINNASVFERDTVATASRESWDLHMETNLRAPFVLAQAFAGQAEEGDDANIINVIDQRVWNLTADFTTYTLSKVGLWGLTQILARALAPTVRVNGVGPGPTLQSIHQTGAQFEDEWNSVPLRRQVSPEDVAAAVRFILDAPTITGQMIAVDGGQHMGAAAISVDREDGGDRL